MQIPKITLLTSPIQPPMESFKSLVTVTIANTPCNIGTNSLYSDAASITSSNTIVNLQSRDVCPDKSRNEDDNADSAFGTSIQVYSILNSNSLIVLNDNDRIERPNSDDDYDSMPYFCQSKQNIPSITSNNGDEITNLYEYSDIVTISVTAPLSQVRNLQIKIIILILQFTVSLEGICK